MNSPYNPKRSKRLRLLIYFRVKPEVVTIKVVNEALLLFASGKSLLKFSCDLFYVMLEAETTLK